MRRTDPRKYYPIWLDITGKECLVVGGGKVAERKVKRLLEHGAKVHLVSPALTPMLKDWADKKLLKYRPGRFSASLIKEQTLVFAATNDIKLNQKIVRLAERKKIQANCAKPGRISGFIVPAVLKRGSFSIAVSTNGNSPAKAKKIKDRLERIV